MKAAVDGFHAAAVAQGVEDEDRPEDDDQDVHRPAEAVQGGGQDESGGHAPDEDSCQGGDQPGQGHGFGRRPAHSDHQNERESDRDGRDDCKSSRITSYNVCYTKLLRLPAGYVAALTVQGIITAIGILIIVFGAILILYTLRDSGGMESYNFV